MLAGAKQLDVRSGLGLLLVGVVIRRKVQVPELNVGLGGRGEDTKNNVSSLGRPHDRVGNLAVEVLDRDEIALFGVGGVKVDVEFDDDTRDVLAVVGVVGRDEREAVSMRFPSELGDVV
jgi:hypothetical protein